MTGRWPKAGDGLALEAALKSTFNFNITRFVDSFLTAPDSSADLSLDMLPLGLRGRLIEAPAISPPIDRQLSERLRNLGFVPGTEIRVLRRAPLGGPIEFELRGFRICLRREDVSGLRARCETPSS
jgi:Fe2+ transport system protein FeoA